MEWVFSHLKHQVTLFVDYSMDTTSYDRHHLEWTIKDCILPLIKKGETEGEITICGIRCQEFKEGGEIRAEGLVTITANWKYHPVWWAENNPDWHRAPFLGKLVA